MVKKGLLQKIGSRAGHFRWKIFPGRTCGKLVMWRPGMKKQEMQAGTDGVSRVLI